jgi:putative transposase
MKTPFYIGWIAMKVKAYPAWRTALVLGVLPKVTGPCETELQKLVEQEPREADYSFSTWTCADLLRELIRKGFAAVSTETIRAHLHTLGYRVRRPVLSIASPDPEYKKKAKKLKKYQKQAKNGEILLYYQDEIDLNLLPGIMRCWTLEGVQRKVPTPGQNQKQYGFGAVNYISGQTVHRIEERKNSVGFCAFIEQFMQTVTQAPDYHGQKIVVVVDNFIIHRSRKTQDFLDKYKDQLVLFMLPTYSPWLNLIERLWKHLRRKVTHNHLFASLAELVKAVCSFLEALNATPQLTLSVIGATE